STHLRPHLTVSLCLSSSMQPPHPRSTLFPYTTLFRSSVRMLPNEMRSKENLEKASARMGWALFQHAFRIQARRLFRSVSSRSEERRVGKEGRTRRAKEQ